MFPIPKLSVSFIIYHLSNAFIIYHLSFIIYSMTEDNVTYTKAYNFAIRIVKAYKYLCEEKKEYVLSKQMLRSGTGIGANIAEANGGISNADFSSKISIAYKECLETKYWLSLLKDTDYLSEKMFESIYKDADELGRILFSILKKTRIDK